MRKVTVTITLSPEILYSEKIQDLTRRRRFSDTVESLLKHFLEIKDSKENDVLKLEKEKEMIKGRIYSIDRKLYMITRKRKEVEAKKPKRTEIDVDDPRAFDGIFQDSKR